MHQRSAGLEVGRAHGSQLKHIHVWMVALLGMREAPTRSTSAVVNKNIVAADRGTTTSEPLNFSADCF